MLGEDVCCFYGVIVFVQAHSKQLCRVHYNTSVGLLVLLVTMQYTSKIWKRGRLCLLRRLESLDREGGNWKK